MSALNKEEISVKLARYLLEIEAVKINADKPFTWVSGIQSPIYCDNRRILSFPKVRQFVAESLAWLADEKYDNKEVVAGVATGAIAHGVLCAAELNLPFIYVRSTKKEHGLGNQVEGINPEGKKVMVVEDLISTAKSSLSAVDALLNAKAEVLGMVAIFSYGLSQANKNMKDANVKVDTLTSFDTLIQEAIHTGIIHHSKTDLLMNWKSDPDNWKPA